MAKKATAQIPEDPKLAFAYLVSRCAEGYGKELMRAGKTATQAKNAIIHHFLAFAAGEACRIARSEGRRPVKAKWKKATDNAWAGAVERTAISSTPK